MNLSRKLVAATLGALLSAAAHPAAGQTAPRVLFGPSRGAGASDAASISEISTTAPSSALPWSGDFTTPSGELWFVSSVTVEVPTDRSAIPADPIDVTFAFDDAGQPGAAVCERAGIVPTAVPGEPDSPRPTLDLPTACQLCAGTRYWLVLRTPLRDLSFSLFGAVSAPPYTRGDFDGDLCFDALLQRRPSHLFAADLMVWPLAGMVRTGAQLAIQPTPPGSLWVVGTDDFNGDRKSDLVLRDTVSGAIEIWFLNGTTRVAAAPLTGIPNPARLSNLQVEATGDFSGDGRPDLLVRDLSTMRIAVWTLDGSAVTSVLTPSPDTALSPSWRVAGAADLNRDGHRDLIWHNTASNQGVLWALDGGLQRLGDPGASGYFQACSRPQEPPYRWGLRGVGVNGTPGAEAGGAVAPGTGYLLWQREPVPGQSESSEYCDPSPTGAGSTTFFNSHERLIIWQGGGRPGGGGPGGLRFNDAVHLHLPGDEDVPPGPGAASENDWWIVGPR